MKYLRYPQLVERGVINNRQTLKRWIDQYGFPRPVRLGPNTAAWEESAVEAWLAARKEATEQKAAA